MLPLCAFALACSILLLLLLHATKVYALTRPCPTRVPTDILLFYPQARMDGCRYLPAGRPVMHVNVNWNTCSSPSPLSFFNSHTFQVCLPACLLAILTRSCSHCYTCLCIITHSASHILTHSVSYIQYHTVILTHSFSHILTHSVSHIQSHTF